MAVNVGLDIGTSGVRAAVVDTGKARPVLRRFGEMPLPSGAVDGGEILDPDSVAEAVAALWKRAKLPKSGVVLGTANHKVVVRQVDVPRMEPEELAEALPFQVQDSIPIAVDEAILDYVPLEEFTTPEGEPMLSILVVAIQREIIEGLLELAATAKLRLAAIDLQAFGLTRAAFAEAIEGVTPVAEALVDIGASVTQFAIVKGGVTRFVRLLPRGGDDFTTALMDGLGLEAEEAEETKRRVGVTATDADETDDGPDAPARRLLTRQADSLIEDIRGSINYFASQSDGSAVERLVVAGNAARTPYLATRFGKALNIPIAPAKVLDRVDVGRTGLSEDELASAQPILPTPIGLGMWSAGDR